MNNRVKKAVKFLTFWEVMTSRNLSSLAIVALFFLLYLMAGGRVSTTLPVNPSSVTGFGAVDNETENSSPSSYNSYDEDEATEQVIPEDIEEETELSAPEKTDKLSEIERRLKLKRDTTTSEDYSGYNN